MNNLYHWHDEQMVNHEMQEVNRAVEQLRYLNEAGLSGTSVFVRAAKALHNLLNARRDRVRDPRSFKQSIINPSRKSECKS